MGGRNKTKPAVRRRNKQKAANKAARRAEDKQRRAEKVTDEAAADAALAQGTARLQAAKGNIRQVIIDGAWGRGTPLLSTLTPEVEYVMKACPRLCQPGWYDVVAILLGNVPGAVRPLEDWNPKSGWARTSLVRGLAEHLYAKYPAPPFLLNGLGDFGYSAKFFAWVYYTVGTGRSLWKGLSSTPSPILPKKAWAEWLKTTTSNSSPIVSLRRAQVTHYGGRPEVGTQFARGALGLLTLGEERFLAEFAHWLARQEMLDAEQVLPLLDWANHRRGLDADFSMRGRTATSACRAMEEWHASISRVRKVSGVEFDSCGVPGKTWEQEDKETGEEVVWEMRELLSAKELHREGVALGHCVYTYTARCRSGSTAIYSLARGKKRLVTIRLHPNTGDIVETRGKFNVFPTDRQIRLIKDWAATNNLAVRSGI